MRPTGAALSSCSEQTTASSAALAGWPVECVLLASVQQQCRERAQIVANEEGSGLTREQMVARISAHQAADTLVQGILAAVKEATRQIQEMVRDDPTLGDALDPEIAEVARRFKADIAAFLDRLGLSDIGIIDTQQALKALGFATDWLPDGAEGVIM
jgi:hypothetical protein